MLTLRNTTVFVLAAVLVVTASGCGPSAEEEIGTGQLTGRTYTHDYFDLRINVPPPWHILTREQMETARKRGRKLTGGFGSGESRRGVMLLCMSRLPMDKPMRRGQFNHNLIIAAERVSRISGVETGEEYLEKVGNLLDRGRLKVSLGQIDSHRKIGHFDMASRGVTISIQGKTVNQYHYACKVDDYFLFVVATYQTERQFRDLRRLIARIR